MPMRLVHARSLDTAAMCERTAELVAGETKVPISVLKAISLTETGRKRDGTFRPWPWTVNMEGAGHWFDTRDEALRYVFREYKRGARSFDVGCFQINFKWHGDQFASIEEMFDPLANGRYAARFLRELYEELGDWTQAAGAFHSRTKIHADRYSKRFASLREGFIEEDRNMAQLRPARIQDTAAISPTRSSQDLSDIPEIPDIVSAQNPVVPPRRANSYPLLIRDESATPRLGHAAGASLFASALARRAEK
ncbi:lytic transglycosylase domain-containing protein [Thioclava sp. BHET1]|nr:lytic transglycosylase domain-containing protein [Thioclava sp. BHET1]